MGLYIGRVDGTDHCAGTVLEQQRQAVIGGAAVLDERREKIFAIPDETDSELQIVVFYGTCDVVVRLISLVRVVLDRFAVEASCKCGEVRLDDSRRKGSGKDPKRCV